jgi:hypothetical protein
MPLVEQKLHTIPEHLQFLMGLVVQDLLVFGWILTNQVMVATVKRQNKYVCVGRRV